MKKGQGLSVQTLVIAALAILVLVIMAIFVVQKGGKSSEKISEVSALDIRTRCFGDNPDNIAAYNKCVADCQKNPEKANCKPREKK